MSNSRRQLKASTKVDQPDNLVEDVTELRTTNAKILTFYKKYKLDFESMNLLLIDLFDTVMDDLSGTMSKTISNEILSNMKTQLDSQEIFKKEVTSLMTNNIELYKSEIASMKTFQTVLTSDVSMLREMMVKINSDIMSKLYEVKQSHAEDMKTILKDNNSTNTLDFLKLIEKENNILIDKTISTINDVLPRNNNHVELLIKAFKDDINKSILEIKDNKKELNMLELSNMIDNKYSSLLTNIQQPILNSVSSSEERISKNLSELKEFELLNHNTQERINTDLSLYLNKYKNSTVKGHQGETKLTYILESLYPSADIINTGIENRKCDIMLKRENKPTILLENKLYQNSVPKEEVQKFCRDIELQDHCAIMISQTSGIATKNNFQIDILNKKVLLYMHHCNYDSEKLSLAINIIDHLHNKLSELDNDTINISSDVLSEINQEYQTFIFQIEALKKYISDMNKSVISKISDLQINSLTKLLRTKFTVSKDSVYACPICKTFVGINKKSLTKHTQSCKKKFKSESASTQSTQSTSSEDNSLVI